MICVNKVDLTAGIKGARAILVYRQIGYEVIYASAEGGEGIDAPARTADRPHHRRHRPWRYRGKSSLIDRIDPRLTLQVGELRDFQNKGKHTTRASATVADALW